MVLYQMPPAPSRKNLLRDKTVIAFIAILLYNTERQRFAIAGIKPRTGGKKGRNQNGGSTKIYRYDRAAKYFVRSNGCNIQAGLPVNPTNGTTVPKPNRQAKRILNDEELERFMAECRKDAIWHDFFYVELTTGLRRGEICGLMWQDFDEAKGTLTIARTLHHTKIGDYTTGDTKTGKGTRTITLPPSTAQLLRKRKLTALSEWIFPDPLRPEYPIVPSSAYSRMKKLLETAGLPSIRFHDLRHTFATTSLEYGMDVKTLSTIIGHNSVATTLNIYAHITDDMRAKAAASIDRGIVKQEQIIPPARKPASENMTVFTAVKGQRRKQGTGCVSQLGDHLWEGKYSPRGPDGKKRSGNVYAHTLEECEEKLKALIQKMKAELAAERERARQAS